VSRKNIFGLSFTVVSLVFFVCAVEAQSIPKEGSGSALPVSVDCSEVKIKHIDDAELTKAEKLILMDRELLRSLSKFDDCKASQINSSSSGDNSSSDGLGQNTGGGSVASSDMSGTEKPTTQVHSSNVDGDVTSTALSDSMRETKKDGYESQLNLPQSADNGKTPEDLIDADNDSVLQAQIRQAAVDEKDPQVRARLWNEYRKYKGKVQFE
jgi:hypothetical protein